MPLESSSLFCFMDSLAMPTIIFKHIESNQGLFKNIIHVRCQEGLKLLWIELLSIYLSQIIIITEESSKVGGWRVCVCVCVCVCVYVGVHESPPASSSPSLITIRRPLKWHYVLLLSICKQPNKSQHCKPHLPRLMGDYISLLGALVPWKSSFCFQN